MIFEKRHVLKILKMKKGKLDGWAELGFYDTEGKTKKPERTIRTFSEIDIYALAIMEALIKDTGMKRQIASRIAKAWRAAALVDGYQELFRHHLTGGNFVIIINAVKILKPIKERIDTFYSKDESEQGTCQN